MGLKTGEGFYKYDGNNNDIGNTEQKLLELLKLKATISKE